MSSKKPDNYLIAKTELGEVKKGFHELPPSEHIYGKAPNRDKYGAREVIGSWQEAKLSEGKKGGKNYIAMNREGIKKGCLDSKTLAQFHKNNEICVKVKQGQRFYGVEIPSEEFIYGVPNRPSTPIKNVITNTYGQRQLQLQAERQCVLKMLEKDQKTKKSPAQPQISMPIKEREEENKKQKIDQNMFKLSKFQNVPSKVKPLIEKSNANPQLIHS